jgi:hypothetical protein
MGGSLQDEEKGMFYIISAIILIILIFLAPYVIQAIIRLLDTEY